MAGLLFELSVLWDAGWWWWHFLRLTAYLLALCYLFIICRRLEETVRTAKEQLNNEIKKRKHKEGDLEKYGLLFHNISDLAYICDTEGNILFLNRIFEEFSGHKPEQFIGKSFAPLFDEENLKKAMDLFTRTLKGESLKRELCYKDTGVLCEFKNIPLRDEKGNVIGILGTARDITERKKAEKTLWESEEKFRKITSSAHDSIVMMDNRGKISFWNEAAERMFGFSKEEIIGKDLHKLIVHERYYEDYLKGMEQFKKKGTGHIINNNLILPSLRKDGTEFPADHSFSSVKLNGKWHAISIIRDITERKRLEDELQDLNKSLEQQVARRTNEWARANEALQIKIVQNKKAEELLQKSKEQLQSILDNSTAVIYLKDKNGKYLLINHKFETLFHVNRNDIMDKTDLDIFPGEMAGVLQANDRKVLKDGVPLELEEIVMHDDRPHTYISLKFPLFDPCGSPDRVCGISTDITKRKRDEEVLRKSEEKYSRLIENLQDNYFFYSHNTKGIFTYLSPAITNILGYTTEEFLTHYSEYMTDNPINEKVISHTDLSIKGIKQPPYELELYHKDGSVRTLKIQEVPVFGKDHNVVAVEGIAEDITERKRAEEKLATYQTQLKRLSSALSLTEERERRHISEDLHDRIGQALTVIKMKLEELKNPQVETDSDRVLNETWDLLDNAIQDTRTLTFEISPPLLYELGFEPAVEWLIEQFRERHNIPIEYDDNGDGSKLDDDVSFFLFKSVRELLFNVIKHARADRIKVSVRREKNSIRISIQDDGVGLISIQDDGVGFDFSKVQFSVNNLSGFGLFSMCERMEHFGGNFDIKSKSGKGARITLIMPLKPVEEDWVKWIKR
jgi:PAS domain S-box-containing protein